MLSFHNISGRTGTVNQSRVSRRSFLKIGGLGLGGWSLSDLLSARAAIQGAGLPITDKAVVFLFMHGGPSQTETFDPKMDAPSEIRSVTGEIPTTIPGVTFGATFPRLARLAKRLAVVRSFQTGDGQHDIKPMVCPETLGANMGSLYARVAGANRPDTAMPTNVALYPRAVNPSAQPANMTFGEFGSTGSMGTGYAPFVPGAGGGLQDDMTLAISQARLGDRRGLLEALDRLRFAAEGSGNLEGLNPFQQQAFDIILGGVTGAFDLSREDPRTVARYDTSALVKPESIRRRWANRNHYIDHGQSLGKLMLMARRLCEAGCGFVTVTTNFVWDMHADQNNATVEEGMQYVGHPFDHAVSAFIEDVHARGLSDRILLVACGEMGRTPKLNNRGGRDHWGRLAPLLLAGGGLTMGQVIGESTRDAGEPASTPVSVANLVATVMHTLLDVGRVRVMDGLPKDLVSAITNNPPIRGLH